MIKTNLFKIHEWTIEEEGFHPEINREAESIFSIGNGYMGHRANFEEKYSGDSLQGSYVAGIYYPDRTKVGWWKVGYPEYYAKIPNSPKYIGIDVNVNGAEIDLAKHKPLKFNRVLNMKEGFLERNFTVRPFSRKEIRIQSLRFLSMADPDLCIIKYKINPVNLSGTLSLNIYLDADVKNENTNYGEKFWEDIDNLAEPGLGMLTARTLRTDFYVTVGMTYELTLNGNKLNLVPEVINRKGYAANIIHLDFQPGDEIVIVKYVSVQSSLYHPVKDHFKITTSRLNYAKKKGFENLFSAHKKEWENIWNISDVKIDGDPAAQQGIRFSIFHLNQTYTGKDERLNIGPKGFTGEKYGGSTYWDTEAFVLPFFLKTAPAYVSKNLLLYRYRHLKKSIENARKLGFRGGAALYPMVTMNGEECHNEWEITFEEIHRNGAIAYAIFNYIRHTGDKDYMKDYGLEVLIGISRFWSQRVSFSKNLRKYVILGVTGPNEYENNVNNNWYTNSIAVWTLSYTIHNIEELKKSNPAALEKIFLKTKFRYKSETGKWKKIIDGMHFPYDPKRKIFLQQDGFLDKELKPASAIPVSNRPINQHWSWDRILRSCYIKQADVLQGLYFFEDQYDTETIKRNFEFYEPMTVHESSLSAGVHSILAARIGNIDKAYELFIRSTRLDLDDYNKEVAEGLHITSMAGNWLAIAEGFGGMRIAGDRINFNPLIPDKWKSYSFHARFKEILFEIKVTKSFCIVRNLSERILPISVKEKNFDISPKDSIKIKTG